MKKLVCLMMALMMFALPVCSMAECRQATISFQHGSLTELAGLLGYLPEDGDEGSETVNNILNAINELIDCVSATVYVDDSLKAGGALLLSGQEVVTADAALEGTTLKMTSNMLNGDVVCVDLMDVVNMVTSSAEVQQLAEIFNMLGSLDLSDLTMANTLNLVMELAARVEAGTSEVTEQLEGCDPAAVKVEFALTGEDMTKIVDALVADLLDCAAIRSMVEGYLDEGLDVAGVQAAVSEGVAEVYGQMDDLVYEIYLDEAGELVAMTVTTGAMGQTVSVVMVRNTTADQVAYDMVETVADMAIAFSYIETADSETMVMTVPVDEQTLTMGGTYSCADDVKALSLYMGMETVGVQLDAVKAKIEGGSDTKVALSCTGMVAEYLSDPTLISMEIVTSPAADRGALTGNEVNVLTLSEEEMESWINGVQTNAMMVLLSAIQALPASVLSLVVGM